MGNGSSGPFLLYYGFDQNPIFTGLIVIRNFTLHFTRLSRMVIKAVIRKEKKNAAGECPICVRITKGNKISYVQIGYRCKPADWNEKKQRVEKSRVNYDKINILIADKLAQIERLQLDKNFASAKTLAESARGHDFFYYFEQQIKNSRTNGGYALAVVDESRLRVMKLWRPSWPLDEFTPDALMSLEAFLRKRTGRGGAPLSNTSIKNYMVRISATYALFKKIVPVNPFNEYTPPSPNQASSKAIPDEDVKKLIKARKSKRHSGQKKVFLDAWLFMYACAGMRWGDLCRLKVKSVHGGNLEYVMNKNKKRVQMRPMPELGKKIAQEYSKGKKPDQRLFPILRGNLSGDAEVKRINNMAGNAIRELKKIAKQEKLSTSPTPHEARHTYANKARKVLGLSGAKETLMHDSERTTKGYTDGLDASEMTAAVSKVIDA
jgi:integrase/recombinase XerD